MDVLFADSVDESGLALLRASGHSVTVDPDRSVADLEDGMEGIDVLVVRSTRVSRAAIENADRLALIVRSGAGVDNIDTQAAADRGVYVCNVPGRNSVAVAELTFGLLLAVDRRIVENTVDLRNGIWNKSLYSRGDGLMGKTIGIIGLGAIGMAVAERARSFGMRVVAQRRSSWKSDVLERVESLGIEMVPTLEQLLAQSDVVSVHVPNTEETVGMINAAFLAQLQPGAILLNTARGATINGPALLDALNTTDLRCGLDVFPDEPKGGDGAIDSEIARHPQVVGTHHIGASTHQAQKATAVGTVETIEAFVRGELMNCVNMETQATGAGMLIVRHQDKVGVLAEVLQMLRSESVNVQQMENRVFRGGSAAVAAIGVDPMPSPDALAAILAVAEVIGVHCTSRAGGSSRG